MITGYVSVTELSAFDYALPADRIAQEPAATRDGSWLLVLCRRTGRRAHARFQEIGAWLEAGDLLVVNDTRVLPARVAARRRTGARLDMVLVREVAPGRWSALVQGARRVKSGETVLAGGGGQAVVLRRRPDPDAPWEVDFGGAPVAEFLAREGRAPLPPYIARDAVQDARDGLDRERYQTVFARRPGAIAAPTAGLHFTSALLEALAARGVERTTVTLHVGPGTFLPVRCARLEDHRMHAELFEVSVAAVAAVERARARGGRVIPVGTTSLRALEAAADPAGRLAPARGWTDLFVRPGYAFRVADGLITNFHLPRSTLLLLVSALAGAELIREAYAEAIAMNYRFYSYGDAMLIL
ncbi:MAG: tRNA preQ1(34) S-adenosylmethionine ribosyltransferase-isomerase QueA [Planctomycetes bacterium]|nr:tRNA preQ1(34) S-adenosylmethionine ribosyltransferase-isomerase QueA [Planctomycetota bacterium]